MKPSAYKKFFTADCEITCLHCDFLLTRSSLAQADLLALNKGQTFHVFLKKEKEQGCAKEGHELFSNPARYASYLDSFRVHIERAWKEIIPRHHAIPTHLSKEEFISSTEFLGEFWYYYGFTEFPYVDFAYAQAQKVHDRATVERLEESSRLKFAAREVLNAYWFEGGTIPNILLGMSAQFLTGDDAKFLFRDELLRLFNGWKPSAQLLAERRQYYGAYAAHGVMHNLNFGETKELYERFTSIENADSIRGITANPGIAKGRAVIAPMLNDRRSMELIDIRMQKGDILIAETTGPELMALCKKAAAIVADQGGMLSHAAIVSRELGIPCVVQTESATRILKDGDVVEVNANTGIINLVT